MDKNDLTGPYRDNRQLNMSLFRTVANSATLGVYVIDDLRDEIVYFNDAFTRIWGLGHLVDRMQSGELKSSDIIPHALASVARAPAFIGPPVQPAGNDLEATDDEIIFCDGRTVRRRSEPLEGEDGRYAGRAFIFEDVTARDCAGNEARKREDRYQWLIDQMPLMAYEMDLQGKLTFSNRRALEVMGYSEADLGRGLNVMDMIVPADRARAGENIKKVLSGVRAGNEYTYVRKDGSTFQGVLRSTPFYHDGKPAGLRGFVVDVTEHKWKEEELRKLSAAIEQSPSSVMIFDTDGRIVYVNPCFSKITGFPPEYVTGNSVLDLPFPNADPGQTDDIARAVDAGQEWHGEIAYLKKNGGTCWVSARIFPIRDGSGKITHYIDMEEDITERKIAEAKLRNLSMALDQSPVSVTIVDRDGTIIYANPSFTRLTGFDPGEVIGRRKTDVAPSSAPGRADSISARLKAGNVWNSERRFVKKDGRECWVTVHVSPVTDPEGNVTHFVAIEDDITERKHAEDELRKLSAAVEQSPAAVKIVGSDGRIVYTNPRFSEMTGYRPEEAIGKLSSEMPGGTSDQEAVPLLLKALRAGNEWQGEIKYMKKSGEPFWANSHVSPIRDETGAVRNYIEISEDITERKRAEERLIGSLREKELLLKEVHHRVKNNLQVISSLLNLQRAEIDRKPIEDILGESQDRIRSIALVHERVYMSEDMARIDFREYLDKMSKNLLFTYAAGARRVGLSVGGDHMLLGVDQAVPCGLIMNELISNCLKHAFPGSREGTISILLRNGDRNTIVIEDDGIGLPADFSFENTRSMGMRLVRGLVDQLDGTITIDQPGGTRFTISFPSHAKTPC